jgi:hypothetical protein
MEKDPEQTALFFLLFLSLNFQKPIIVDELMKGHADWMA